MTCRPGYEIVYGGWPTIPYIERRIPGYREKLMACGHCFGGCEHPQYERCHMCGTYRSLGALPPEEIYGREYWSDRWGHSSIYDQVYNVEEHHEGGKTKNGFVLGAIDVVKRDSALEIGCAPGALLGRLARNAGFAEVVGLDTDPAYEDALRDIGDFHGELMFGYFPSATSRKWAGSFSLIVGLDVFEHSPAPVEFLAECRRLLKLRGQLLLMLPLVSDEMDERFFHPIEHVYIHTAEQMTAMLEDALFGDVRFTRWCAGHDLVSARAI